MNFMSPEEVLKKVWGYENFRPLQFKIISNILDGNDVLGILPTGGGKSLCFQIPGLCMYGICLVITPIIALMKDQVEELKKKGIKAAAIYSGMSLKEIDITLDNCIYGQVKFLYVSPERLKSQLFIERVKKMSVKLLAIDEAHCISQWGYDFRPAYLEINNFKKYVPEARLIALTATATREVTKDIIDQLAFNINHKVYIQSFARPNLSFIVRKAEDKDAKLLEVLQKIKGSAIIYVRTRKRTKEIVEYLIKHNISSDFYHAGLGYQERSNKQDRWMRNVFRVMVATNAFGMGINKPDVRLVVHGDLPDSIESFYQEAGRGGRDGKKAYAALIYHEKDIDELRNRIKQSTPEPGQIKRVYQSLANFYKIAVGSSLFASYDFDLREFSQQYQLDNLITFHAIKKLEDQGFIQLNESFYHPSKLLIQISHDALYKFQVANQSLEPLIKSILRIYGGEIYSNFTIISEKKIANLLRISVAEVERKLEILDKQDIIVYDKRKDQPQITFTTPRYDASKIPLDIKFLEKRRSSDMDKAEAMIHYVTQQGTCRSVFIQNYFGETAVKSCGECDICLEKTTPDLSSLEEQNLQKRIQAILFHGPSSLNNILNKIEGIQEEVIIAAIQHLLDSEDLYYDENGYIYRT